MFMKKYIINRDTSRISFAMFNAMLDAYFGALGAMGRKRRQFEKLKLKPSEIR